MVPEKKRKPKTDVTFSLMSLLLKVNSVGVVANSSLARENKWTQGGLSSALKVLTGKGLVICTEANCHDKRVALRHDIKSHSGWLLEYYGGRGNVPPRYQQYLEETETVATDTVIGQIELIIEENERLKKENKELNQVLSEALAGIEKADATIQIISRLIMRRSVK